MGEEFNWPLFIDNLWERENAKGKRAIEGKGGYHNGLYFPYTTPNGDIDIGPGLDMSKQTSEFQARAQRGFTREELDSIVKARLQDEKQYFNQRIAKEGGDPTKLSNSVYAGLLDMQWQLGNSLYKKYPEFWKAVAARDYEGMQNESKTYYGPEGNKKLDEGRWNFRKQAYFQPPVTPPNTMLIDKLEELRAANPLNHSEGGQIQKPKPWSELSITEKAEMMGVAIRNGITDLPTIRQKYNEFAEGGGIRIAPSKKGTFTAAASRHGMGVQEFASKVLAHPENYSPAMRKKANFARNAAKWHALGGPLVEDAMNYYAGGGENGSNQYGFGDWLKKGYHGALQFIGLEDYPYETRGKERYAQYNYIGGTPRETRQKYFDIDQELKDSVNSIATRHGLNPSVVASRMAEEGPIDAAVRRFNDKKSGIILSDDGEVGTYGPLWGVDDFYTRAKEGKVNINTPAPYSYKKRLFINENGRLTESITSPQWWFGIEATAAELEARRNKLKKNNPWMDSKTLDAAVSMSFNMGETGAQKYINSKKAIPSKYYPYIRTK